MPSKLSIIMYHYVRDLKHSRFPEIKGLATDQFLEQILFIKKHYHVICPKEAIEAVLNREPLPPKALLLTFDDGYADHYTQVFPILDQLRLSACFFPPARSVLEKKVLTVNKIHFILASVPDKNGIIEDIFSLIENNRNGYQLKESDYYWSLVERSRYDTRESMFIKCILQRDLPAPLRTEITDQLFSKYVSQDEAAFASELYLSADQIKCMIRHGMYVGSHSYNHDWLDKLPEAEMVTDLDRSLDFLKNLGAPIKRWIMNYPYGAYSDQVLSAVQERNCAIGLSTTVGVADLEKDHALTLPRLDTNDLPKERSANPNQWYQQG